MRGKKYQLFGPEGLIYEEDTRTLDTEIPALLEDLRTQFYLTYIRKIFNVKPSKREQERLQRKLDQARMGLLTDKEEERMILEKDKQVRIEYELRKREILNATNCDEAHVAAHYPKVLNVKLGVSDPQTVDDYEILNPGPISI